MSVLLCLQVHCLLGVLEGLRQFFGVERQSNRLNKLKQLQYCYNSMCFFAVKIKDTSSYLFYGSTHVKKIYILDPNIE